MSLIKDMLGQTGFGAKQITDRYQQYPSGPYMPESYSVPYAHEPVQTQYMPPSHGIASKHYGSSGGHKNNAAMSALTLLAFLFFLNILQQCLKDHMTSMNTPSIMIMSGGREGEEPLPKTAEKKIDKSGQVELKPALQGQKLAKQPGEARRPISNVRNQNDVKFTKVNLAHYKKAPRDSEGFPGFVSAMTTD